MKIINVSIELVIDDNIDESDIPEYLNHQLYNDPEWFGEFGPENIISIKPWE
jgi:hypothetical protein